MSNLRRVQVEDVEWAVLKPHLYGSIMDFFASGQPVVLESYQEDSDTGGGPAARKPKLGGVECGHSFRLPLLSSLLFPIVNPGRSSQLSLRTTMRLWP